MEWIESFEGHSALDPFFVPDPTAANAAHFDQGDGLVGVRVDLTDWTALRAEYRATKIARDELTHPAVLRCIWGL